MREPVDEFQRGEMGVGVADMFAARADDEEDLRLRRHAAGEPAGSTAGRDARDMRAVAVLVARQRRRHRERRGVRVGVVGDPLLDLLLVVERAEVESVGRRPRLVPLIPDAEDSRPPLGVQERTVQHVDAVIDDRDQRAVALL